MQATLPWYEHVRPPIPRGKVLLAALGASLALHAVLFALLARDRPPRAPESSPIDMEIVAVPPPPPPPLPETIQDPVAAPKPKVVLQQKPRLKEPPPPPNSEPPPEAKPDAKPPPIRIGIHLESTTEGGSMAVGTGNTLYGKADSVAGDPSEARPYAAQETTKAPFVPVSRVTSIPVKRKEVKAPYPEEARRSGIEGRVTARIRIDERGRVTSVQVLQGPGHGLDEAARKALYQFEFDPAMVGDRAVATEISYVYTFQIE
jgi:protein TonB